MKLNEFTSIDVDEDSTKQNLKKTIQDHLDIAKKRCDYIDKY